MSATHTYQIYSVSDQAVTLDFGGPISVATNDRVYMLMASLLKNKLEGVTDIIPAYSSITVVYDYMKVYEQQLKKEDTQSISSLIKKWMEDNLTEHVNDTGANKKEMIIPVCYDKTVGLDIESVAQKHNLTIQEVIELHTAITYRVFMNGFLPGFAYMGIVDPSIQTPRHESPRPVVKAGSVGIAGVQTGIYPSDSPGGWQIIGKTPVPLIDENENILLKPGSFVKFNAISLFEFEKLNKQ
jgi:inhibitor of KinA